VQTNTGREGAKAEGPTWPPPPLGMPRGTQRRCASAAPQAPPRSVAQPAVRRCAPRSAPCVGGGLQGGKKTCTLFRCFDNQSCSGPQQATTSTGQASMRCEQTCADCSLPRRLTPKRGVQLLIVLQQDTGRSRFRLVRISEQLLASQTRRTAPHSPARGERLSLFIKERGRRGAWNTGRWS